MKKFILLLCVLLVAQLCHARFSFLKSLIKNSGVKITERQLKHMPKLNYIEKEGKAGSYNFAPIAGGVSRTISQHRQDSDKSSDTEDLCVWLCIPVIIVAILICIGLDKLRSRKSRKIDVDFSQVDLSQFSRCSISEQQRRFFTFVIIIIAIVAIVSAFPMLFTKKQFKEEERLTTRHKRELEQFRRFLEERYKDGAKQNSDTQLILQKP